MKRVQKLLRIVAACAFVVVAAGWACAADKDVACDTTGETGDDFECVTDGEPNSPTDGREGFDVTPSVDDCSPLLDRACGTVETGVFCDDSSACTAATLLATYEPENCGSALADTTRYPACETDSCGELMIRVCGASDDDTGACSLSTECSLAARLQARAIGDEETPGDPDGLIACAAALEDSVVFPPCAKVD